MAEVGGISQEATIAVAPSDEVDRSAAGAAIFSNKFYVTNTPAGARLAFAEQVQPGGAINFRAAVFLSYQDAIELLKVLKGVLDPIEAQLAAGQVAQSSETVGTEGANG